MIYGTREDLLWLAGLLEGEGSFDAHRGKYARIRLAMTDRDVVGRAATLMGAQFRLALHPAPAKATWHTEISGSRAAEIMAEILPFMGARRSQRIADVLGVVHYRAVERSGARLTSSTPGPRVGRPAGIMPAEVEPEELEAAA